MTITLVNYVDATTGYSVNGTQHVSYTVDTSSSSAQFTGTSTASMTLSGGPAATETWDVGISGSGQQQTLTFNAGTVTCNGATFDAATLQALI
jgi:hypothetical protein